jgi:hypothetical protein
MSPRSLVKIRSNKRWFSHFCALFATFLLTWQGLRPVPGAIAAFHGQDLLRVSFAAVLAVVVAHR